MMLADTHPPATRAPATAAMASMAATPFQCMTNILLHQGCDWAALPAGSRPSGEPEPPPRAGRCYRSCALVGSSRTIAQPADCLCRKASARSRRFKSGTHRHGVGQGQSGTPSHRLGAGLVAAGVEEQREGEQSGRGDRPQQQHGLLPAQARVEAARLWEDCAPARVPPGAARTGWWPPAPHSDLLACRHLLVCGQPAEDVQHGSQPGVRTGLTVRNGAQGLPLWFVEAHHHHVQGGGMSCAGPGCMSLVKAVLRGWCLWGLRWVSCGLRPARCGSVAGAAVRAHTRRHGRGFAGRPAPGWRVRASRR
jgi:hypothetical protein